MVAGLKAFGLVKKDLGKMPGGSGEACAGMVVEEFDDRFAAVDFRTPGDGAPTRVTSAGRAVQGANGGPLAKMRRHLEKQKL